MKRKALTLFLALCVCFSLVPAYAINESSLEITNGKFASEEMVLAQETLDSFFSSRNYTADAGAMPLSNSMETVPATEEISNDTALRTQALKDFWLNEDVEIVATSASSQVLSAKQLSRSGNVDAVVYEWTWVDYLDGDSTAIDRMGFATIHDMTLEPTNDGAYRIVRDGYDELDISGHVSADYDENAFERRIATIDTTALMAQYVDDNKTIGFPVENIQTVNSTSSKNNNGMSNVWNCIEWADLHVYHDIASSAHTNARMYDLSFGIHSSYENDCANYVSQCLLAGGFENDYPNWYNDRTGDLDDSSTSWRGTLSLAKYLAPKYGVNNELVSTSKGVYPGNPVWRTNKGHVAICVGQNSAGRAIINGHTRDVYHQPIDSGYSLTLYINDTLPYVTSPKNAASISAPGSFPSNQLYLQAGKGEWFKITPSTTGRYKICSTGSTDTYGILYDGDYKQSSYDGDGDKELGYIYLNELANDDNNGLGSNFSFTMTLTAGKTYYVMVRGAKTSTTGSYGLSITKA